MRTAARIRVLCIISPLLFLCAEVGASFFRTDGAARLAAADSDLFLFEEDCEPYSFPVLRRGRFQPGGGACSRPHAFGVVPPHSLLTALPARSARTTIFPITQKILSKYRQRIIAKQTVI